MTIIRWHLRILTTVAAIGLFYFIEWLDGVSFPTERGPLAAQFAIITIALIAWGMLCPLTDKNK
jgi:hypothetical protein